MSALAGRALASRGRRASLCRVRARQDAAFQEVCSWIDFFGGHVHPKLDLAVTSLKCRGVVATAMVTDEDQIESPLIVVPDSLTITSDLAMSVIDKTLDPYGLPSIRRLPHEVQVALYLAYEKKRGTQSRYHPYLATMPEVPPCGWLMSPAELSAALQAAVAPTDVPLWTTLVAQAQEMYEDDLEDAEVFVDALALDPDDVRWALGQAVSRSYGDSPRLIPALDCVNHNRDSIAPIMIVDDNGKPMTAVGSFDRNWNVRELDVGEELFVNYAPKHGFCSSPVEMFIDYGFVPEELLEGGMAAAIDDEDFDV